MKEKFTLHQPVMLAEVIEHLAIKPDGVYLDATIGRGGHAQAILNQLGPTGRLLAMDKDPEAVAYACQHFLDDKRFMIQHGTFAELAKFVAKQNLVGKISGILFDLGVSSPQLDNPERGFSFMKNGKLDMRMDFSEGMDAATWIAKVDEKELADVLWIYGEERFSRRIARAIVAAREITPITTTLQLAEIIRKAMPVWQKGKHPATRSFQAIRIKVNRELDDLKLGLVQGLEVLSKGGRLLVISFHSLEDRLVKQFMQQRERGPEIPAGLPIKHTHIPLNFKRVGRAIKPSMREIAENPRARSAVLRIGEKLS
ncbi:MAG TPA: 16S rRNA (cytosine(1402)-N(4))-methyltransferase RsmH [Gammaproteobacteria bacterium]|nr:16S rRNA (cytosine(1402)-N(4))-methyltransferase RsmH [Gammaproteobacteria bacterium]